MIETQQSTNMMQLLRGKNNKPNDLLLIWLILVICCRFRTPLPFPIIDSFPPIFRNVQKEKPSVAIKTDLSTSTATGLRLNWIIDRVKPLLDLSEREEICNSLSDLAQIYSNHSEFLDEDDDY